MKNDDIPLMQLTTGEFKELLERCYKRVEYKHSAKDNEYVYGIAGIAKLFGCSHAKAYRIKKSGIIDKAIVQVDRTITVNARYALELASKREDSK